MSKELILKVLADLLKLDDVLACMVATRGLEGIVPSKNKIKDINFWKLLSKTTSSMFNFIDNFYDYKLQRIYFELGDYTVIIAPVSKQFGLVVVLPSLANMGLLDVEVENVKRQINEIVGKPAKS